jgi:hypothetical protein
MNDQSQLLLRSIKGPVIMITVGVLFAADRFTNYQFHQTWPVLLIVVGLLQFFGGRATRADYYPPPAPPPAPSTAGAPHPYSSAPPPPPAAPAHPVSYENPEEPRS